MASGAYRDTLNQQGLPSLLWTQFLGVFNDNFFKIIVSLLVIRAHTGASAGRDLSIVGATFVLPFLVCSGWAGQFADVQSKRTVLIVNKVFEILAAVLACGALVTKRLELSYAVLLLFALRAVFVSPATYGILPEMLSVTHLSRANGLLEMSTFVGIVAGTATGSFLFGVWPHELWAIGAITVTVAVIGFTTSVSIPDVPAAHPRACLHLNPWTGIAEGLQQLRGTRALGLAVFGISYFWFMGALLQLVVIVFGVQMLRLDDGWVGGLTACAGIGIGVGSLAAGRLSCDTLGPGLVPIGAIGMGLSAILLSGCTHSFAAAAVALALTGFCGGLFVVPLNALLQHRAEPPQIGRVMATNNVLNMVAILLASGALVVCIDYLRLSPDRVILAFGVVTVAVTLAAWSLMPAWRRRVSRSMRTVTGSHIVGRFLGDPS
jgi:acyl-[acyl-carrier-protein]-phospholipid O-acyltransferase / long-chain-fatty-acid--[acyl-carrier-protein] ligase